jgi:hypothetical protein
VGHASDLKDLLDHVLCKEGANRPTHTHACIRSTHQALARGLRHGASKGWKVRYLGGRVGVARLTSSVMMPRGAAAPSNARPLVMLHTQARTHIHA